MPNRDGIVNLANWAVENKQYIGYSQQRPGNIGPTQHELKAIIAANRTPRDVIAWDCDMSITWLYKHSGSKDPNGWGFSGLGNTSVMAAYLRGHYTDPRKCLPGAIGVYGLELPLAEQHGIVYLDPGGDPENPWVWSMGSEEGPLRLRLADESAAHRGASLTWLAVGGL